MIIFYPTIKRIKNERGLCVHGFPQQRGAMEGHPDIIRLIGDVLPAESRKLRSIWKTEKIKYTVPTQRLCIKSYTSYQEENDE